MHSPGNTTDEQDMIKIATVSLMTDYLNQRADSEILQVVNYAKAAWESYFQGHAELGPELASCMLG